MELIYYVSASQERNVSRSITDPGAGAADQGDLS
jgi:hypothetical protein